MVVSFGLSVLRLRCVVVEAAPLVFRVAKGRRGFHECVAKGLCASAGE